MAEVRETVVAVVQAGTSGVTVVEDKTVHEAPDWLTAR